MGSGKLDDNELDLETAGGYVPPKRSTLIVDTEGGQAPIRQGDMSDAQFAALTKQTAEAGKLVAVEHPDGSRTDGKSLVESFGKGRPIIGPDGSLVKTDTNFGLEIPTAQNPFPGQVVADQGDQTGMPTTDLKFGIPTAQNPFPGQVVADQGDQTGMPTLGVKPDAPASGAVPLGAGAPGADELAPLPDLSAGAGVKAKWPFGPPPDTSLSPSGDYGAGAARQAMELGSKAADMKAAAEAEAAKGMAAAHNEAMSSILASNAERKKIENQLAEGHERFQKAVASLDQQIEDASRAKVDTRRYFSNMDTGQQVAAVLAGACFGAIGQGMQWLSHVKSLVDQDIDAQKADFERRLHGLQMRRETAKDMYSMMRQAGLDGIAASEAATAFIYKKLALDAAIISDNANVALAKSNALAARGGFMDKYATHIATSQSHHDSFNLHKAQLDFQVWKEMQEIGVKLELKGGKVLKPTAEEGKRIAQLVSLGELGANTYREFEKAVGRAPAPLAKVADVIGLGGSTDANAYETATAPQATQNIGKSLEGKMTDADAIRISSGFVPHPGDTENRVNAKKRAYVNAAVEKYKATLDAIEGRGASVSGFLSPEAYAAHIAAKVGVAVADEGKPTTLVRPGGK